jgi:hypothetical protein
MWARHLAPERAGQRCLRPCAPCRASSRPPLAAPGRRWPALAVRGQLSRRPAPLLPSRTRTATTTHSPALPPPPQQGVHQQAPEQVGGVSVALGPVPALPLQRASSRRHTPWLALQPGGAAEPAAPASAGPEARHRAARLPAAAPGAAARRRPSARLGRGPCRRQQDLEYTQEVLRQLLLERDNKSVFLQVSQHHVEVLQVK